MGEPSKIALPLIGVAFFNTLMTADAVRSVPMDVIQVSYTLGARRAEVLLKVLLPHALKIFAMLVVIGLIGLSIDVGLRLLRERVGRWQT